MAIATNAWTELGASAQRVSALAERINQVRWFHQQKPFEDVATLADLVQGVCRGAGIGDEVEIEVLATDQLADFIRQYDIGQCPLWETLREVPAAIQAGLEESNHVDWLSYAADKVPTSVFHSAFDGAFTRYGSLGQEAIRFAACVAMWISGAAIGLALLDRGATPDGFATVLGLLELCEHGVLPLGLFEGVFYLA